MYDGRECPHDEKGCGVTGSNDMNGNARTRHHGPFGLTAEIAIRTIDNEASTHWLTLGWRDMMRSPGISFGWGALFVAISYVLFFGLSALGLSSLILPLAAGFLLVGPLAAVGLYEVSRRHEHGLPVTVRDSVLAWRRNPQIGLMGVLLLVAMFAWIQVALILFAMFFLGAPPTLAAFVAELTSGLHNLPFLVLGTLAGGVLAASVFAVSVVSLPLLLDRPEITAADAVVASWNAAVANWRVMIGWAATVAVVAGLGILTFFLGLLVALPLLGHANWHAYRALVR